jgi:hypothetical protein
VESEKMSEQPEALRLAAGLEGDYSISYQPYAATELRRLHAENEALRDALRLIENTDPLDASLDRGWAVRVARVALKETTK